MMVKLNISLHYIKQTFSVSMLRYMLVKSVISLRN